MIQAQVVAVAARLVPCTCGRFPAAAEVLASHTPACAKRQAAALLQRNQDHPHRVESYQVDPDHPWGYRHFQTGDAAYGFYVDCVQGAPTACFRLYMTGRLVITYAGRLVGGA